MICIYLYTYLLYLSTMFCIWDGRNAMAEEKLEAGVFGGRYKTQMHASIVSYLQNSA